MILRIVKLNSDYCDYLRKFDKRVPYNKGSKELRPFIGILFVVDNCEYFAPLSSPKPKHLSMKGYVDFIKIKDGELGVVNFNNMVPVRENNYTLIDLDNDDNQISSIKYNRLLKEQSWWIKDNFSLVQNKARKLYKLYMTGHLAKSVRERCCDFPLLESKCEEYNKVSLKEV